MKIAFSIRHAAGCFTRCFLTLFFFLSSPSAQSPSADLLLLNAHVVTMYDKQPSAEEKGKLADLTVISEDITKIPPREILSVRVLKTFVGGKAVYDAETAH